MSSDSEKPKRPTVASVSRKIDDLTDVIDIIHSEVGDIKDLIKVLMELQMVTAQQRSEDKDWERMFG